MSQSNFTVTGGSGGRRGQHGQAAQGNAEGRRGRGTAPGATLNIPEQIWDTFGKSKFVLVFDPKSDPFFGFEWATWAWFGAKSRPQHGVGAEISEALH